ncbi:MAG: molybdopterin-dependent oxidoreductase, partial [Nitrospirales bacterium]|nr:molybdopterin-dependent oxidoreductase [Nitrospirales bacterium]
MGNHREASTITKSSVWASEYKEVVRVNSSPSKITPLNGDALHPFTKNIFLNGVVTEFLPGETILQIATRKGILIPTLCHDTRLTVTGHCKVCLVEINGKMAASCNTQAEQGMMVVTHSERAVEARKKRVSAIIKQHKGNCATCRQYEFCGLLQLAGTVGLPAPVFSSEEPPVIETVENKLQIDISKCIRCGKCVRVCADIRKVGALRHPALSPDVDKITFSKECERCGQCAVICPTGAIVEIHRDRPDTRVQSVCTYCGTGCSIYLDVKGQEVVGVTTDDLDPVGMGNLCVKGRFGFGFINHPERLRYPLIREGKEFREASWDEALSHISQRLSEIRDSHGPEAIGGIGSARATNEDNYLFQRMMRGALGTNNLDNCARLCHIPAATALKMSVGISASTSSLEDLAYSDVILVVGSNTTEAHPISSLHIKWAHTKGSRLIVIDPRKIPLAQEADLHLQLRPGTNAALLNGMMRVIIEEGLYYREFVGEFTEGWEKVVETALAFSLDEVAAITGVPKELIVRAARIYGSSRRSMIISGLGVDEHEYGTEGMLCLNNLALATGNVGKPGNGIFCLRGQNNVQGSCDMGCLPGVLPGYQPVTDKEARERFSEKWGAAIPAWIGKNSPQMMVAAREGSLKALYIWGEDPMHTHGDTENIRKALSSLDFLVYQDIFFTKTAELAHVVLPASSFAEKDGTFTNTERRVRLLRKAIEPVGSSR